MNIDRRARRKWWLTLHLWLGLSAGAVLALTGLSGSVLVFRHELEMGRDPALMQVAVPTDARWRSPLELAAAARAALPADAKAGWVEFPSVPTEALQLTYRLPQSPDDGYSLFLNPYTGTVTGTRLTEPANALAATALTPLLFKLHYALLLEGGEGIVGTAAAALLVSVLTGVIVWWPLGGKFRQALNFKYHARAERLNFELHKSIGFYLSLLLLLLLFSGVSMTVPTQFNALLALFTPLHLPQHAHSGPAAGRAALDWGQAAAAVERRYPEGRLGWLLPPADATGIYQVCKTDIATLNRFFGYRCVWVDQYSAEIVQVIDLTSGSVGDVLLQSLWPLHSGRALGWTGRLLVFFTGLACPLLYLTGVIRWWHKRRAARAPRRPFDHTTLQERAHV